jgi:hypothetical protein
MVLSGVESIQSTANTYTCEVKAVIEEEETVLNSVTYDADLTPSLTSVSPRYGSVEGGTTLTFTGVNFVTDTSLYSIVLDGINCPVQTATETEVTCLTQPRPGLVETSMEFFIQGKGYIS